MLRKKYDKLLSLLIMILISVNVQSQSATEYYDKWNSKLKVNKTAEIVRDRYHNSYFLNIFN